jgi:hypothetical protein
MEPNTYLPFAILFFMAAASWSAPREYRMPLNDSSRSPSESTCFAEPTIVRSTHSTHRENLTRLLEVFAKQSEAAL